MNIQLNDRLKDSFQKKEGAILFIPEQYFLALQVNDCSVKFDLALRVGILKYLSQRMRLAYEKEVGTTKAPQWKPNAVFSLEKQQVLPKFEDESKGRYCTLLVRQPGFLTEDFIKETYRKIKRSNCHPLFEEIEFVTTGSRLCSQIIHSGSTEKLAESLALLDQFVQQHHYEYADQYFREIDLVGSSGRKILRCNVREVKSV